jgi:hypothetical protein
VKLRSLICWCLMVVVPLSAWPQSQPSPGAQGQEKKLREGEQASKVKGQIQKRGTGEKATVKVTLRNRTELKGYISQIDADSFQVTGKKNGQVTTIAYTDVDKVRGPGLSKGAQIAIAVGIGAGILLAIVAATLPKD